MNSPIVINGASVNRAQLLNLINNNKKLLAIKSLREQAKIGLKASKDIVEALEINPNYQPNDSILTAAAIEFDTQQQPKKGSHFITPKARSSNLLIFIALALLMIIVIYFVSLK
ncbi:hypothetical protein [Psychroserpens damuponensis]|uniref:hypothetical protein n=1 Tax=Psychroserpens damuponensis TaxID=943936 RepID=UPI00058E4121|nr:hypothetical protein [Psychroserpens damuponensis]